MRVKILLLILLTTFVVSSPATGRVAVVDVVSRAVMRTIPVAGVPRRIAFSATGLHALIANEMGWVDVLR